MPGAEDVPKNHAIKMLPRTGFEPVTYGFLLLNRLQSTALPTELSRDHDIFSRLSHIYDEFLICSINCSFGKKITPRRGYSPLYYRGRAL